MAVKCPFCGDRIEWNGEPDNSMVQCETCHATVDAHLADPLPDVQAEMAPPAQPARGEPGMRGSAAPEAVGVGSYSLKSNDMKHAKETVFGAAAYRSPAPKAPADAQDEFAAPAAEPGPRDAFRFRAVETQPPAPPPPPRAPKSTAQDKLSIAYRPDQIGEDVGPEIPAQPDLSMGQADMNQTLDRLSGFVLDTTPSPPPQPPPPPQEGSPGGVRLDDLDLSFDDLQPLRMPESTGSPRAAGDPGTTLDLDAVMKEESFADALPPWAEPEPPPASQAASRAESPWSVEPAASSPPPAQGPAPSGFGEDWMQTPAPDQAPGAEGVPPSQEFGFEAGVGAAAGFGESLFEGAPGGSLQLDMPSSQGAGGVAGAPPPAGPVGAAAVPAVGKGKKGSKAPRAKGASSKPVGKPILLGLLLVVLVGLILGQTQYGYFGINLLGGGKGPAPGGLLVAPGRPAEPSKGVPDRRDAWQKEVVRLQRLAVDNPKDTQVKSDLLILLARFRERFPSAVAADPASVTRLKDLLVQVRLPGEQGDLVKALDLMFLGKWEEAKPLLERLAAMGEDPYIPYLQGRLALAQGRTDDAQRDFEKALAGDASMLAAAYSNGLVQLKKKDLAKARAIFESILGREGDHLGARLGLAEVSLASGDADGARRMAGEVIAKAQPGADADDLFGAHLLLSRVENQKGAREERLRELRAALGIRPTDQDAAVEVATLLRADGKPGEALAALGPAREAGRDAAEFLRAYALAAFADDKGDLAEAAVAEGIQKHPKNPVFHVLRGRNELEHRRMRSAISSFEEALKVDPSFEEAWVLLAKCLASEGRLAEASERLRDGLSKTNQAAGLLLALAQLQKDSHDMVNAETTLRQAVSKDPGNALALQDLGLIVAGQGRMEEAVKILSDLDARRQLDREGVLGYARALMVLRQPGQAREVLQRVHDAQAEDWDVAAELGRALYESGQDKEAETVLRKVIQMRPSHHTSFYYLGRLFTGRGDRERARDAFENAIKADSRDPLARIELARLLLETKDVESTRLAKNQLDAVLGAYSRNEVAEEERDPDAYLMHGRILFDEQKYSLAMKDFEAALARAPTRTDIMVGFARSLFESARYDDAKPYLRQVLSRDSQHPEANFLMGRILVREGKSRQAREHLEKVVQRDPRSFPEAHRLLGMIYRDEGLAVMARSSFQAYLKHADPKSAEAEEIRQLLGRMR